MLTLQQIFDKAVGGVIRQGRLAREGACSYRLGDVPDGPACGVGQLIPNEHYTARMEGCEIRLVLDEDESTVADERPLFYKAFDAAGVNYRAAQVRNLLIALQAAHDSSDDVPDFRFRARQLARERGLDLTVFGED